MFLLIVGWRLGPTEPQQEKAQLLLEYEAALEARIPILAYIREDLVRSENIADTPEEAALLAAFVDRLQSRTIVGHYSDPSELAKLVVVGLSRLFAEKVDPAGPTKELRYEGLQQYALPPGLRALVDSAAERSGSASPPIPANTDLVFIELVEQGEPGPVAEWAADFIRQQVNSVYSAYAEDRDRYFQSKGIASHLTNQPIRSDFISEGMAFLFERAQEVARRTTGAGTIHGRHLLATLLGPGPKGRPYGAHYRIEAIGLSLTLLRERLYKWVRGYGDDDLAWREILLGTEDAPLPLSAFASDQVSNDNLPAYDYIDISPDVQAFSTLIAARTVSPPLSIGLFGEWGSGKTFFMRRLRHEVARLATWARDSKQPQKSQDFYKHIIQIEFNAWHYVEGNLWASLVEHIFENLSIFGEKPDFVAEMQKYWLGKLNFEVKESQAAARKASEAQQRVADAAAKVEEAQQEHQEKAQQLSELSMKNVARAFTLSGAAPVVRELARSLKLQSFGDVAVELEASLKQARTVVERGSLVFTPLIRADDRKARWVWLMVVLLGAPLAGWVVALLLRVLGREGISAITGIAAGAATILGGGVRWVTNQARWVSNALERIGTAQAEYDKALAAEQAETARKIAALEQELEMAREVYAAARREVADASRREAEARQEFLQADAGRLLARFVQDRASSSDYRQHLGVLALVRDDFEKLSSFIEAENARLETLQSDKDEEEGRATRINRIVLYIDDLDRCPPSKVVDVLQAVHLLLAFPLFVVVVGVDARWVARSLETRYRELLHAGASGMSTDLHHMLGVATSDDYLEKIFQIPFWVQPLDLSSSQRMLRRLVATDQAQEARGGSGEKKPSQQNPEARGDTSLSPDTRSAGLDVNLKSADNETPTPSLAPPPPVAEGPSPSVESLEIRDFEMKAMDALAPILGRSPRALKRFVNTYRVLKASFSPAERTVFLRRSESEWGNYAIVLFLLAVATGLPEVAPSLFSMIVRRQRDAAPMRDNQVQQPDNRAPEVALLLHEIEQHVAKRPSRQWTLLKEWLSHQELGALFGALQRSRGWVPRVARFSFDRLGEEAPLRNEVSLEPAAPPRQHG